MASMTGLLPPHLLAAPSTIFITAWDMTITGVLPYHLLISLARVLAGLAIGLMLGYGLALVAGLIEFFGGLLLALGLLTRPVAALVCGLMAVAVVQVHFPLWFWTDGGLEYPLFWAIVALSYVIRGGGRYSLDAAIGLEF